VLNHSLPGCIALSQSADDVAIAQILGQGKRIIWE
jgi:hypothetical protein